MTFRTDQEGFWAGEFGVDYIERNSSPTLLASNLNFFVRSLQNTRGIETCIEFGANVGMNLKALKLLFPNLNLSAIEINSVAAAALQEVVHRDNIFETSILNYRSSKIYDLVLIKGVLIHINPDFLPEVYDALYRSTGKYLLVCEYYDPSPVALDYRGHKERLFKRDFAGELMRKYTDLTLLDYGFVYRRDPNFPQDDITWFLMQKSA